MEIRQLITFAKIIELQSFSKAAQALGYSQSAVTVQIRLLEEELGIRLFDRVGRHTRLTSGGEEFRSHAYRILHEVDASKRSLSAVGAPDGSLHIGTLDTLCAAKLPSLLKRFHESCPKASVRVTAGSPETLFEMMNKNQLDLIYILDEPHCSGDWHKELEVCEEIIFVSTPAFAKTAAGRSLKLKELLSRPFLLTEKNANYRRSFDRYLAAHEIVLRPFLETSNTEVLLRTLEAVDGISLLPRYFVERELSEHRLAALSVEHFHTVMYRQIFYHRDKWKTPEMDAFIRIAKEVQT